MEPPTMQQEILEFPSRAHIEFCFDVRHGRCSIHTRLRVWHPDMQPVGALRVCALDVCQDMGPASVLLIP